MSAFKQNMRKLAVRAGLLTGVSAAVLVVAGIGAGSAMASGPVCPNPGSAIKGEGSTLQKDAQLNVWNPDYNAICSSGPTAGYEATGSGPGLEAFGFTGSATEIDHALQFIGTDEAPNASQITAADTLSGGEAVIVPVTQTAIAVVVHPPEFCKFKANKGITWAELNKVFGGKNLTNWDEFSNIEAESGHSGACNASITRVVREEGSGTTYQFKNYLSTLETDSEILAEGLPCTTEGHTKWAELEKNESGGKPNTTWPTCTGDTAPKPEPGGDALAEYVKNNADTIGYVALPDAKGKEAKVALLQNGKVVGVPRYASPENTSNDTARCESARYTLPSGYAGGIGVDWSDVFGAQPTIGGTEYPLCTLTFDIGWTDYVAAGYGSEAEIWGEDVWDYLGNYVVPTAEGQANLVGNWYSTMPANVQTAAEAAAAKLPAGGGGGGGGTLSKKVTLNGANVAVCKFAAVGEICKINFTVTGAGEGWKVQGDKWEGAEPEVRYKKTVGCTVGKLLKNAETCTDEIEMIKKAVNTENKWCVVWETESGALSNVPFCTTLKM